MIGQGLHIAASSSLKGSSESGGQLKDRISKKKSKFTPITMLSMISVRLVRGQVKVLTYLAL